MEKAGPIQAFPNSVQRPIVSDKYKNMRMSLTYMLNHVTYKYIHTHVHVHINNQAFLEHIFKGCLCGYLTSTGFTPH